MSDLRLVTYRHALFKCISRGFELESLDPRNLRSFLLWNEAVQSAEQTPLTALRFGELALQAGLPPGALNILAGASFSDWSRSLSPSLHASSALAHGVAHQKLHIAVQLLV